MRASAACRCTSTTRRHCTSPATAPSVLAQSTSRWGLFSYKSWWSRGRSESTTSRVRVNWQTWVPSNFASTVTVISSSSLTSLRLRTQQDHHLPGGSRHLPARKLLAYYPYFLARCVVFTEVHVYYTANNWWRRARSASTTSRVRIG